ncbi:MULTISPECIES: hypothetical protein [unclassified Nitratiruptor]|uniref:hypothetical protein n=1 Tax=unclassified Nitratiruptor TaxID=2624044 RepID=UPI0019152E3D|nr:MULTISPECIES: hypothetical protein [unclassified Nitratiruptor]BCD59854.1 hypothetical protein NitYY0810_C0613 [Nitratiruptor sp. YY08-10]BCD63777.1 hypothetical protein NitYY0814_C0612 [Nitratiruptor sp. YY08-14]
MRLDLHRYLYYKFFNSLFTGLSVGTIFVIYEPLEPSIYSLGGIVLALGMLVIAKFYDVLLNIKRYFQIGLLVEVVILVLVSVFLLYPYTYMTALFVYAGYQLTFMFGAYLVRAETLIVKKALFLTKVDVAKQIGYLGGMVGSYLFYKIIQGSKQQQVYDLHFLLLLIEIVIIWFFIQSFKRKR